MDRVRANEVRDEVRLRAPDSADRLTLSIAAGAMYADCKRQLRTRRIPRETHAQSNEFT